MWFKIQVLLVSCLLFKSVNSQIGFQQCTCVAKNTCYQNLTSVTDGSGVIDIRIVNQNLPANTDGTGTIDIRIVNQDNGIPTAPPTSVPTTSPGVCTVGNDQCCSGPGIFGCGLRYNIPFTPITIPTTGQVRYGGQPWQVIIFDVSNNFVGGGALVDTSNVVTAAHKVVGRLPGTIKVRLGEWDVARPIEPFATQEALVAQIRIHPLFSQTVPLTSNNLQNNVAVLRLASPIVMNNPAINTICLPSPFAVFDGQRCLVAGWGKDAFNGSFQAIAKEVEVPVVPYTDCQTKLRSTPRLGPLFNLDPNSFMCAGGEPGKDACTGDGGSALACIVGGRYQLAGLVAWGIGCADSNVPGVYVKMSTFVNWTQIQLNS